MTPTSSDGTLRARLPTILPTTFGGVRLLFAAFGERGGTVIRVSTSTSASGSGCGRRAASAWAADRALSCGEMFNSERRHGVSDVILPAGVEAETGLLVQPPFRFEDGDRWSSGMTVTLDVAALARKAGAQAKNALTQYEQEPTSENKESLSEAISIWERALSVWSLVVDLAATDSTEPVGVIAI